MKGARNVACIRRTEMHSRLGGIILKKELNK
jgi:hypothetical protein